MSEYKGEERRDSQANEHRMTQMEKTLEHLDKQSTKIESNLTKLTDAFMHLTALDHKIETNSEDIKNLEEHSHKLDDELKASFKERDDRFNALDKKIGTYVGGAVVVLVVFEFLINGGIK
jgi:predicted  nucleic acid-binding Zn-ribbon protein